MKITERVWSVEIKAPGSVGQRVVEHFPLTPVGKTVDENGCSQLLMLSPSCKMSLYSKVIDAVERN